MVGNKCDLATEEQIDTFRKYVEEKGLTFVPISAATMQGVKELPGLVYNRLKDIPAVPVFAHAKQEEPEIEQTTFVPPSAAPWRIAGEVLDTYIVCEDEDKNVWLIDKHAAHERVNFDRMKANQEPLM